jgi:hypothetical protein
MEVHFILKIFKKPRTKGSLISKIKNKKKSTKSKNCIRLVQTRVGGLLRKHPVINLHIDNLLISY